MRRIDVASRLVLTAVACLLGGGAAVAQQKANRVNPESPSGLDYYSQGGVVVDGIAYFTANDSCHREGVARTPDFPCVVAFDLRSYKKLRAYQFSYTYDSSPLVFPTKDGAWL